MSCGGRRNKWEFRLTKYCAWGILQEALVRGLKLHNSPRTTLSEINEYWALIQYDYVTSTTLPDRVNG